MKLLVFSESAALRKQMEDLLSSGSHVTESRDIAEMVAKTKDGGFDGILSDYDSWQRSAALFRYFDCLDVLNQKPLLLFSKSRKAPSLKLRRAKAFTTHCSLPVQNEEFQAALQQVAAAA